MACDETFSRAEQICETLFAILKLFLQLNGKTQGQRIHPLRHSQFSITGQGQTSSGLRSLSYILTPHGEKAASIFISYVDIPLLSRV